jgi:hypothetical protein
MQENRPFAPTSTSFCGHMRQQLDQELIDIFARNFGGLLVKETGRGTRGVNAIERRIFLCAKRHHMRTTIRKLAALRAIHAHLGYG